MRMHARTPTSKEMKPYAPDAPDAPDLQMYTVNFDRLAS